MKEFKSIKNFVFDLDGTLYSDLEAVFGQVSKRMTEYISKKLNLDLKKAKELQTNYFHKYNTSLNGLLIHHDVKAEEFLEYVHDIDLEFMEKDIVLREELLKLDAKKFVFTNGSHGHVKQITKHLGIDDLFNGTFAITDSNYVPKPELTVYNKLCNKFNIKPEETVLIEDIAKNLEPAKKLGMKTAFASYGDVFDTQVSGADYDIGNIQEILSIIEKENQL